MVPDESVPTESPAPTSALDFPALRQTMPDVVGWIVIEGTNINYPIVQGVDNDYYLNHLPDGTANRAGSIMLDAGNQQGWCDDLNVVHGHRMRTGDMFGSLHLFGKSDYAMEHLNMILYTPGGDYRIELIAACTVDGKRLGFPANFQDDAAFEAYVGQLVRSSAYKAGWLPEREDRLILLSTCAYVYDNARFVLLGRLAPLTAETSPVQ
ncbi:MAG: class B sortase [Clostridia bacterium]|nr:class B sortase [Clostridia bacterium]